MRRSWILGLGCLFLTTPLHAGPTASADQPQVELTPTTKAAKKTPYKAVDKLPQATSVDPRVSVGDVGIVTGIDTTALVDAAGLWPVHQYDATHPNAPEKVSLIRNANHRIDGTDVRRKRAVGTSDGSVFVFYTKRNSGGGPDPHIRKIKPDNQLGFDVTILMEDKAGIAPDGAGGVYVVTHKGFASDGEFYHDQTAHTSLHYDSAGNLLWQIAEPGAPKPHTDGQHWSVAARSSQGVFVGYGVNTGTDQANPILLHRKASDGSKLFTRTGLKAPTGSGAPGTVGNTPLLGIVDRLWPVPDGSVIARVYRPTTDQMFVRVDASGVQTAAYKCPGTNPHLLAHLNGGVMCVVMPSDGTIQVHHFGVNGGNLQLLGTWRSAAVNGWSFGHIAVTVDGQYLATASTTSGFAGLALFSASGVLLHKTLAEARPGRITDLIVGDHAWLAMHQGGEGDPRKAVFRGAFAPGSH
jgi:hypothetical protein